MKCGRISTLIIFTWLGSLGFTNATNYPVGAAEEYTTIQSALDDAMENLDGEHTVTIMDSATYDEFITIRQTKGNPGLSITIAPAAGQKPTIYGCQNFGSLASITLEGLICDGNLRPYNLANSGRGPSLIYMRYGKSDTTTICRNLTLRGRGQYGTLWLYGCDSSATYTIDGCKFENDDAGITNLGITGDIMDGTGSDGKGDITIENCIFNDGEFGISCSNWDPTLGAVMIRNNIFNKTSSAGIYQRKNTTPTNLTIENNTFYKCGGSSPYMNGAIVIRDSANGLFGPTILNNLIVGKGGSGYDGLIADAFNVTDMNAEHNGFWNMSSSGIAYFDKAWNGIDDINAFRSAKNNIVGESDPFADADNGDFSLIAGCWALKAASDRGPLGARTSGAPKPANLLRLIN